MSQTESEITTVACREGRHVECGGFVAFVAGDNRCRCVCHSDEAPATILSAMVDYSPKRPNGERRFTVGCVACGWTFKTTDEPEAFAALEAHDSKCYNPRPKVATEPEYDVRLLFDGDELRLPFAVRAGKDYELGDDLDGLARKVAEQVVRDRYVPLCDEVTAEIHRKPPETCADDDDTLEARWAAYRL